ncbi:MAG: sugar ABC transporter ATP-binding protein [Paracoccus denitrificans]|uniref:Sugar ABC transporter ATP-binding protein n=1 Tax=Paracoccus denitrificans TaxID=266 RepID=A0A533IB92_PARDE|nr:MAG: sugar ABC transporter ATP-binding protein [Paracoccus denitrificans]
MTDLTFAQMSKSFGGVRALDDVTLRLRGGRVHALMGENGAGKSTLIKLIAGVTRADGLAVRLDGQAVPLNGADDAHRAGFRFIHQELNIVPQLSVAENILLSHAYPRRFGIVVDWPQVRARAQAALERLGAGHIDVKAPAGSLPVGERMLMKIAAALVSDGAPPVLYVLDEPTAALTGAESEMLFKVIARLKAEGATVLYVSHRLDEVMAIADDVTVLRDGRHVSTRPIAETSKARIIEEMTGREVADVYPPRRGAIGPVPVLRLQGVATDDLTGLDFDLHPGEVLGVTGLAEAGQSRLLRMLVGQTRLHAGRAEFEGRPLPRSPAQAWSRGIAYIPRERRAEALMLGMPIRSNIVLPYLSGYGPISSRRRESRDAARLARDVRLKAAGMEQPVGQLSGGNQQKVVFARAVMGQPRLLLLDEPTRGVDVGAKHDIYDLVRGLAEQGCAVILTSTDLPEVIGMCDRVLVLQDGRQAHLMAQPGLSAARLLGAFYDKMEEKAAT